MMQKKIISFFFFCSFISNFISFTLQASFSREAQRLEIERLDEEHRSFEIQIQSTVDENARQILKGERALWTATHPLYQDHALILTTPGVSDETKARTLIRRGMIRGKSGYPQEALQDLDIALHLAGLEDETRGAILHHRGVVKGSVIN